MVLAASQAMCGEVRAVFGALRDVHLDVGAMLPPGSTYGQHFTPPTGRTARTPDRAAMQPGMEDTATVSDGEYCADNAFWAYRAPPEKRLDRQRRWA
jgi:hypothetical protein